MSLVVNYCKNKAESMEEITWTDIIRSISAAVSAMAAISIPLVLAWWAKKQDKSKRDLEENRQKYENNLEIQRRTYTELKEMIVEVSKLLSDIMELCPEPSNLSFEYISINKPIQTNIVLLLNHYEHICAGANKGIFDGKLIALLRGDVLKTNREIFSRYISGYRKNCKYGENAWCEIDTFLKRYK